MKSTQRTEKKKKIIQDQKKGIEVLIPKPKSAETDSKNYRNNKVRKVFKHKGIIKTRKLHIFFLNLDSGDWEQSIIITLTSLALVSSGKKKTCQKCHFDAMMASPAH